MKKIGALFEATVLGEAEEHYDLAATCTCRAVAWPSVLVLLIEQWLFGVYDIKHVCIP